LADATRVYALLEASDGTLYAGTGANGDVFKSTDGGSTWTNTGNLADATYVHALLEASDGTLYAGTELNGDVFKSTDGGSTWTNTGDLAGATYVHALLEASDGTLYAGTYPNGYVFKSTDSGSTWTNTGDLAGATYIWALLEASDGTLYAGTEPNGDVFKSTSITTGQAGLSSGNWIYFETVVDNIHQVALGSGSKTLNDYVNFDQLKLLPSLVDNGGMEGTKQGSDPYYPAGDWANAGCEAGEADEETTKVHSGSKSWHINASGENKGIQQTVNITTGKKYTISCWVYVVSGTAHLDVSNYHVEEGSSAIVKSTSTDTWERLSMTITASHNTDLAFWIRSDAAAAEFYVDDAAIVEQVDLEPDGHILPARYRSTKHDKGIYITSDDRLTYDNVYGNTDQFSFVIRFKPQFEPYGSDDYDAERTLFDYCACAGTNIDEHCFRLYFDFKDGTDYDKWKLAISGTDKLSSASAQEFTLDDNLELSGWFKSTGRYYEDAYYYGKMFLNGIEIASLTAQTNGAAYQPNKLCVGGKLEVSNGSFVVSDQCDSVIDELVLFPIALSDDELIGYYTDDEPIANANTTRKYAGSLDDHDILTIESATGEAELYDASAGTETQPTGLSGNLTCIRGNEDEEQIIYFHHDNITDTPKLKIIRSAHYRS